MKDFFFLFGFLIVLAFLSFQSDSGSFFDNNTPSEETPALETASGDPLNSIASPLTEAEKEAKVYELYASLDTLKDDLRDEKLWSPASPYRGVVEISSGNTWDKDPDAEYLVLRYTKTDGMPVNISDWYLESYVTKKRAGLPKGDRILRDIDVREYSNIFLSPQESAYIITGDSPIDVSFKENLCTGYLNDEEIFYPTLSEQCVSPMEELEDYGRIRLNDDRCYDFVETLGICEAPKDRDVTRANIRGRCEDFLYNTFNYDSCVLNHERDPFFSRDGYWYIYLERSSELWRPEREIIRLRDENDRIVAVLEY